MPLSGNRILIYNSSSFEYSCGVVVDILLRAFDSGVTQEYKLHILRTITEEALFILSDSSSNNDIMVDIMTMPDWSKFSGADILMNVLKSTHLLDSFIEAVRRYAVELYLGLRNLGEGGLGKTYTVRHIFVPATTWSANPVGAYISITVHESLVI